MCFSPFQRETQGRSRRFLAFFGISAGLLLSSCASTTTDLPSGPAAYERFAPADDQLTLRDYLIRPGDQVSVLVYGEPELSLSNVTIDSAGQFSLPFVGVVSAAGMTSEEVAQYVRQTLDARYIREPQVAVNVVSFASRRVTVDGSVVRPGVYEIPGAATLLSSVAMAQGVTPVAKLDEVAILRSVDGNLMAAKFDLEMIRTGDAPDPEILPGDTVVVGFSALKSAYRDVLQAIPLFALFTRL